ncbi:MAG: hypothetical protein Ta2B_10650 [Termitinemataceae bacterium]|nr:MAG: hypothetical protein Ta2B_10650 [Termitinemataceae bacterium]
MPTVLKYALDLISPVIWFFAVYLAFYRLHRPPTLLRRRILLILMALWAIFLEYVFNPLFFTRLNVVVSTLLAVVVWFVIFALVCGNVRRSFITAVYCYTAALFIDYIYLFAKFMFSGSDNWLDMGSAGMAHLSGELQIEFLLTTLEHALFLVWAVFYCRTARRYPANLPLRSFLLIVLPPVISSGALIYLWTAAFNLLEIGTNIFGLGLGMGIFLFLLNCFLFYWHITLLAGSAEKAELQRLMAEAQDAVSVLQSRADSNWSRETGLSEAFVAKYQFSEQERHVLELAILGKVDKEIAKEMNISPSTVKTYSHRVYVKTDTYGRGGVFSLIHGGGRL